MAHHTVATMLALIIACIYALFLIANAVVKQDIPDGQLMLGVVSAITALALKGYYDHLKILRKPENQ